MFIPCAYRGRPCLLPKRAHYKLVVVKEPFTPLIFFHLRPLVGIPQELVYPFLHGIGYLRAFTFHNNEGNPIYKEHDIRGDEGLSTRHIHPELVDRKEIIPFRVFKINDRNTLFPSIMPCRVPSHLNPLHNEIKCLLIRLQQFRRADSL